LFAYKIDSQNNRSYDFSLNIQYLVYFRYPDDLGKQIRDRTSWMQGKISHSLKVHSPN